MTFYYLESVEDHVNFSKFIEELNGPFFLIMMMFFSSAALPFFPKTVEVGFQTNQMEWNDAILHGATDLSDLQNPMNKSINRKLEGWSGHWSPIPGLTLAILTSPLFNRLGCYFLVNSYLNKDQLSTISYL